MHAVQWASILFYSELFLKAKFSAFLIPTKKQKKKPFWKLIDEKKLRSDILKIRFI